MASQAQGAIEHASERTLECLRERAEMATRRLAAKSGILCQQGGLKAEFWQQARLNLTAGCPSCSTGSIASDAVQPDRVQNCMQT
jgi:hypothetical protein